MSNPIQSKLKIFSGRANRPLAERIVRELSIILKVDIPLGRLIVDDFPDGETNVRIDEDVRGRDVFIVQPTCTPVNQNLTELLVILDAFKRASPSRITVVLPYYAYARQDRKDKGRVPITAKLVADLLTTAGANRVLCLDLHTAQIQGFFNIPVDHIYASREIIAHIRSFNVVPEDMVVLSSDEGAIKKALKYQKGLGAKQIAVVDKRRSNATTTEQAHIIGAPVEGKTVVIFDDMISTGGTIAGAARAAMLNGAKRVFVASTHGVLCAGAVEKLRAANIEKIIVTDTVPISDEKRRALPNLEVISVGKLLAEAVYRIHENYSLTDLFQDER